MSKDYKYKYYTCTKQYMYNAICLLHYVQYNTTGIYDIVNLRDLNDHLLSFTFAWQEASYLRFKMVYWDLKDSKLEIKYLAVREFVNLKNLWPIDTMLSWAVLPLLKLWVGDVCGLITIKYQVLFTHSIYI